MTEQSEARTGSEAESRQPQRRCICCRGNGAKNGLLRFGQMGGQLVFDLRQKMPGRGYYVCALPACLKKAWESGFKRVVKVSPQGLAPTYEDFIRDMLIPGYEKRYNECIVSGRQSGQLLAGSDAVEQAAREDRLLCYVIATDASESTRKKYELNAERKGLPVFGRLDRTAYGKLIGSDSKVVLGWTVGSTIAEEFMHIEHALARFVPTLSGS